MMEDLTAFLTRLPKVELHVHLESTMPGELLERFAARQGKRLPRPADRLYDCSAEDLSDFLAFLDRICAYVGTPQELAEAAAKELQEYGINEKDIQIYIETDESEDGSILGLVVNITLPEEAREYHQELVRILEYELGAQVRLEYGGEGA